MWEGFKQNWIAENGLDSWCYWWLNLWNVHKSMLRALRCFIFGSWSQINLLKFIRIYALVLCFSVKITHHFLSLFKSSKPLKIILRNPLDTNDNSEDLHNLFVWKTKILKKMIISWMRLRTYFIHKAGTCLSKVHMRYQFGKCTPDNWFSSSFSSLCTSLCSRYPWCWENTKLSSSHKWILSSLRNWKILLSP